MSSSGTRSSGPPMTRGTGSPRRSFGFSPRTGPNFSLDTERTNVGSPRRLAGSGGFRRRGDGDASKGSPRNVTSYRGTSSASSMDEYTQRADAMVATYPSPRTSSTSRPRTLPPISGSPMGDQSQSQSTGGLKTRSGDVTSVSSIHIVTARHPRGPDGKPLYRENGKPVTPRRTAMSLHNQPRNNRHHRQQQQQQQQHRRQTNTNKSTGREHADYNNGSNCKNSNGNSGNDGSLLRVDNNNNNNNNNSSKHDKNSKTGTSHFANYKYLGYGAALEGGGKSAVDSHDIDAHTAYFGSISNNSAVGAYSTESSDVSSPLSHSGSSLSFSSQASLSSPTAMPAANPAPGSVTGLVLSPFTALSADELSLTKGTIVFIHPLSLSGGSHNSQYYSNDARSNDDEKWWFGSDIHGRAGKFPVSHVQPVGGDALGKALRSIGVDTPMTSASGGDVSSGRKAGIHENISLSIHGSSGSAISSAGRRGSDVASATATNGGLEVGSGVDDGQTVKNVGFAKAGVNNVSVGSAASAASAGLLAPTVTGRKDGGKLLRGETMASEEIIANRLGSWKLQAREERKRADRKEQHRIDELSDPFSKLMLSRMEPGVNIQELDEKVNEMYQVDRTVLIATMGDLSDVTARLGVHHVLKLVIKTRRILGVAIAQFDGTDLVKTDDRKSFIACMNVSDATAISLLALELVERHNSTVEDEDSHLQLQFGIDWTGSLLMIPDDYFGDAVNVSSKLGEDSAAPGEIYLSSRGYEALRSEIEDPSAARQRLWKHVAFEPNSVTQSKVLLHYMDVKKKAGTPAVRALIDFRQNVPLPRQLQRPSDFVKLVLSKFEPGADEHAIQADIDRRYMVNKVILVSDMSSFTYITRRRGIIHFLAMIYKMRSIVIPIFKSLGGTVIKFEADNVFALFEDPKDAVEAAIRCNEALTKYNRVGTDDPLTKDDAIRISIGIAQGDFLYVEEDEDVFGETVDLAFVFGEDMAEPYEVMVSEGIMQSLTDRDAPYIFKEREPDEDEDDDEDDSDIKGFSAMRKE